MAVVNPIEEIRKFVKLNARKIDNKLVSLKKPLVDDEPSQKDIDCSYHLLVGNNQTVELLNGCVKDFFNTKMRLYISAKSCDEKYYDKGYCKAIEIRNQLVNLSNVADNDYIEESRPISILPSSNRTNEKVFIFDINLNIKMAFGSQ